LHDYKYGLFCRFLKSSRPFFINILKAYLIENGYMQRSKAFMIAVLRLQALPGVGAKPHAKSLLITDLPMLFLNLQETPALYFPLKNQKHPQIICTPFTLNWLLMSLTLF